jgi:hypothetical protein
LGDFQFLGKFNFSIYFNFNYFFIFHPKVFFQSISMFDLFSNLLMFSIFTIIQCNSMFLLIQIIPFFPPVGDPVFHFLLFYSDKRKSSKNCISFVVVIRLISIYFVCISILLQLFDVFQFKSIFPLNSILPGTHPKPGPRRNSIVSILAQILL